MASWSLQILYHSPATPGNFILNSWKMPNPSGLNISALNPTLKAITYGFKVAGEEFIKFENKSQLACKEEP